MQSMHGESRADVLVEIEGIKIYDSPWVSGMRAVSYHGPIDAEVFVMNGPTRGLAKALREVTSALADKARVLGANAIVGLEFSADPFAREGHDKGARFYMVGTAATLEPLFSGTR